MRELVGSRSSARWRRQAIRSTMRRHGRKLAECRESALVLHGDAGQLLRPAAARAYRCPIPGARLVILPASGTTCPVRCGVRSAPRCGRLPTGRIAQPCRPATCRSRDLARTCRPPGSPWSLLYLSSREPADGDEQSRRGRCHADCQRRYEVRQMLGPVHQVGGRVHERAG